MVYAQGCDIEQKQVKDVLSNVYAVYDHSEVGAVISVQKEKLKQTLQNFGGGKLGLDSSV